MGRTANLDPEGPSSDKPHTFAPTSDEMKIGLQAAGQTENPDGTYEVVDPIEGPEYTHVVKMMRGQLRDGSVAGGRVGKHDYVYALQGGRFGITPMVCIDNAEPKRLSGFKKEDEDALEVCAKHFQEMHVKAAKEPKPKRMDEIANEIKTGGRDTPRIDEIERELTYLGLEIQKAVQFVKDAVPQETDQGAKIDEQTEKIDKMIRWADRTNEAMIRMKASLTEMEALTAVSAKASAASTAWVEKLADELKNVKRRCTVIENKMQIGPSARKGVPRKTKTPKKKPQREDQHERDNENPTDSAPGSGTSGSPEGSTDGGSGGSDEGHQNDSAGDSAPEQEQA